MHELSSLSGPQWTSRDQLFAGVVPALPKFTPATVSRFIKSEAQPYTELAAAYSSKKQQDLPGAIEKHQARFIEVHSPQLSVFGLCPYSCTPALTHCACPPLPWAPPQRSAFANAVHSACDGGWIAEG